LDESHGIQSRAYFDILGRRRRGQIGGRGALAMAVFGLGTLPLLLAAGWLAAGLRAWRVAVGGVVLGFGTYGLAHAGGLGEAIGRGLLCL